MDTDIPSRAWGARGSGSLVPFVPGTLLLLCDLAPHRFVFAGLNCLLLSRT